MIRTEALTKRYGRLVAVDGVSVEVPAGSVVAVLGPNGAGKTTLVRLLAGVVRPSGGSGQVFGHDLVDASLEVRRAVALVPESKALYGGITAEAFVRFYTGFHPDADPSAALARLTRWGVAPGRIANDLSSGNRTRVLLAAVLSRRPGLFVLDEPTEGLDAGAVEDLWSCVMERVGPESDAGVVLSTHRLEDAERVCDRVLVLRDGRLVLAGDLDDVRAAWRRLVLRGPEGVPLDGIPGIVSPKRRNGITEATTSAWEAAFAERLPTGVELLEAHGMSLREIYLEVVGHAD